MREKNDELRASWGNVRELGRLYLDNLKLLSVEKMTVLFSHGVLGALLIILGACALFFISMAIVFILGQVLPIMWCFLIMGGFYLLVGILLFLFRTQLLVNPIARFLSRLFLENPEVQETTNQENKK